MARDIAFVAEKDTPEGAGTPIEPGPLTDGPRSEGAPAARARADETVNEIAPPPADLPPEPSAKAEPSPEPPPLERAPEPAPADPPPEVVESAPAPPPADAEPPPETAATLVTESPAEPSLRAEPQLKSETPRTEAVEKALAEPHPAAEIPAAAEPPAPEPTPPAPAAEPSQDAPPPPDTGAALAETAGQVSPKPELPEPPAPPAPPQPTPHPPTSDTEGAPARDDASPAPNPDDDASSAEDVNAASFTSAAEGLFRPPEESSDDTHLITTGRRFNPRLSVPEPVPPVPQPAAAEVPSPASPWKRHLWTGARYAAYAAAGYLALVLLLIVLFRFVNPPGSMLMLTKLLGGTAIDRTWVPFEAISPALARAVIVSEDSRFCAHRGIDMQAMRLALEEASRGAPRGASTISMQVTKNLFLWNAKSYVRKVIEIPLTLVMEVIWPKARIIEVYLNIAEWGPGVFGAEAAARHHFNKSASRLTEREAALLAAALPNPMIRVASNPGPRTSRMARVIQTRVRAFGSVARCVVAPSSPASPAAARPPARNTPAKKPPAKKPQQKQDPQEWAPTLRFGP